jgi:hypothetical protein
MAEDHVPLEPLADLPDAARLDALAEVALMFPWPLGRDRDPAVGHQVAYLIDKVLAPLSRGRGALEIAIGEGLAALAVGDRVVALGYSNIGDYAREALGINASTAVKMARLARGLRDRPLLREALRSGSVTPRKAETVLAVARGGAEAIWVERAQRETVRALRVALGRPASDDPDEEAPWKQLCVSMSREERSKVDEAFALARKEIGPAAPKPQLFKGMCEEYLGAHSGPAEADDGESCFVTEEDLEPLKEFLEQESRLLADLAPAEPVEAPPESFEYDAKHLDVLLRRRVAQRDRWEESFEHLAMLMHRIRGWELLDFASFAQYCEERLGMAPRTVTQRASLERSLYGIPILRRALREKRLSYEKARLLARDLDPAAIPAWIEQAETMTCIELRRALEGEEERQMCARGAFRLWLPASVAVVASAAFRAARREAGHWISPSECLLRIAEHFVEVWKPRVAERETLPRRIRKRDRHFCQVPGCSRPAVHTHHLQYRAHGGSDDEANLIGLCAVHHLRAIHEGLLRVTGVAPDQLRWVLADGEIFRGGARSPG